MKKLLLLCSTLLGAPMMSMELIKKEDADKERTLWPRHITPLIIEANFKSRKKFLLPILACVNKELSEDVPYEDVRLTWESFRFDSPLSLIIKHRKDLLWVGNPKSRPLKRDRYLTVAKRFLENKADSNMLSVDVYAFNNKMTLLQQAAYRQDKELCKLSLEHGGDPFITTVIWEPQGPGYEWTAFDYAHKPKVYEKGDDQPRGWLKDLWDEVQKNKQKNEIV